MKQLVIIIICCCFVMLTGCQNKAGTNKKAMQVIIEDSGKFPEFMTGKWKANKDDWEINFNADGSISEAVIAMGKFRVKPGEITTVPMRGGKQSVLKPMPWLVEYSPSSGGLTIVIEFKSIHVEIGEGTLDGTLKDIFIGEVSEKNNTWYADWFAYPSYVVNTNRYKNHTLAEDPNSAFRGRLVFSKVESN